MLKTFSFILVAISITAPIFTENATTTQEVHHYTPPSYQTIAPFTGKVIKDRVRLRLEPSLDGTILKELNKGDYLVVTGEEGNFFAVKPSQDCKGYIYSTYVINGIVEGNYVNIRLAPQLDGEIVAQANNGDRLHHPENCPTNHKWLEFDLPESTRFFVAKNLVEKVGDVNFFSDQNERQQEASTLLESTYLISQHELQKPFNEINLTKVFDNFQQVMEDSHDFPEQVERAQALITQIQDLYLEKKAAFLEAQTESVTEEWELKNSQLSAAIESQKRHLTDLQEQFSKENTKATEEENKTSSEVHTPLFQWENQAHQVNEKLRAWLPAEKAIYEKWVSENGDYSMSDFYSHQYRNNSIALRGTIEPYLRSVKKQTRRLPSFKSCNRSPNCLFIQHTNRS